MIAEIARLEPQNSHLNPRPNRSVREARAKRLEGLDLGQLSRLVTLSKSSVDGQMGLKYLHYPDAHTTCIQAAPIGAHRLQLALQQY